VFRRYHVVEWGPSDQGYEEVVTSDRASVAPLSDYLATHLAHGDHSVYVVVAHPGAQPIPVTNR
jgi:hypothetical protein